MRKLLIAVLLMGAAASALAQNTGSAPRQPADDSLAQATQTRPAPALPADDQDWRDTCYTMRSYLFARNNGEAPRLVGMTTCTSSRRGRFYRAGDRAKFGI